MQQGRKETCAVAGDEAVKARKAAQRNALRRHTMEQLKTFSFCPLAVAKMKKQQQNETYTRVTGIDKKGC